MYIGVFIKKIIIATAFFICSFHLVEAADTPNGGAVLEFPRGRFQENTPPDFFKWSLLRPAHSVSLKIYHANEDGKFTPEDLIIRYDFLSLIQSATWTRDAFPKGNYAWTIELYDENSPDPMFIDSARFLVEPLRHYDIRTTRMGAVVGFSRGQYESRSNYTVSYDTTPTTYGLMAAGGTEDNTWFMTGYMSDFILQGSVQRTFNFLAHYDYRIGRINRWGTEIYAGPSIRAFQFPRARSFDGSTIQRDTTSVLNPGGNILIQKRFDLHVTLFTQLGVDLPVLGTDKVKMSFDQLNYNAHAGMIYGLFWPIGFSGEIQYRTDKAATYDDNDLVYTTLSEWSVVAHLLYAF